MAENNRRIALLTTTALPDIKPQNILLETSSIREMFEHAPPEAFAPDSQAGSGHVIESIQVSSADEDLAQSTDVSVKLADFGTGENTQIQCTSMNLIGW